MAPRVSGLRRRMSIVVPCTARTGGRTTDVLDRQPAQLERAFTLLFTANPVERVLRLLDEDSNLRDDLRLIGSLPPGPYLLAAARRLVFPRATRPAQP